MVSSSTPLILKSDFNFEKIQVSLKIYITFEQKSFQISLVQRFWDNHGNGVLMTAITTLTDIKV